MDFCPHQDSISNYPTANEREWNIIIFLGEAENILLGLKKMETTDDDTNFSVPLRFGRPILEPLDASLEPAPLRHCGGFLNLVQPTPAAVSTTVSPKRMAIPNVSPSHHAQRLGASTDSNEEESNLIMSFSSLDCNPLRLEDIHDQMEPSPRVSMETATSDPDHSKKM